MTKDDAPKLHIDSDWKAEAQAEKERLAAQEQSRDAEKTGGGAGRGLPAADFRSLVGVLASQALMGLGTIEDPQTKGVVVDLEGSRFAIDLLAVLEEKTKGNLTEEEAAELRQLVADLRARFVQLGQLVAQQAAAGGPGAAGGAGGPGGPDLVSGGPATPGIHTP
ncbi:MAG: DUF1844 domain-containing protein [Phycisphaerales bacterium]|nr:DUF1844 domain-containing protein [Phycisphaerae bacterium]NNF42749.1 DUF1844 domain-containing protein [Phycisphaerales bacterium]NNM24464.1 DUF1844 domain-containing protein [Phycisphaerales bacterium]